jgi:hypothetical protein
MTSNPLNIDRTPEQDDPQQTDNASPYQSERRH